MFINNKFRRFVITCLSVCAVGVVSAGAASVDTKAQLDDVAAQMQTYKSYMDNAHSHAETARSNGVDEDHEVIQSAKVLWNDANETYQDLVIEYNKLNFQYKTEVAAEKKAAEEAAKKKTAQQNNRELLGKFKISAYTPDPSENGGSYLTADGTRLAGNEWSIVAADTRYYKYGTKLYIEGVGTVTIRDCGGAITGSNRLDLLVPVGQANSWGIQYRNVYLVK